jgi:uncharacterized protein (TIGR03067 family)
MRRCLLTMFVLNLLLATSTHPCLAAKKELDKLAGIWVAVSAERDGKPAGDVKGHQLTFSGDTFIIKSKEGEVLYQGTFRADPAQRPATIDFRHTKGKLEGQTWKGIYTLEGTTLKTCDNAPDLTRERPTDFSAKIGSGRISIVFQRAKP